MNVQEYISSGIVESYVLGLASPEERAEFERMCAAHSDVLAARNAFELLLENQIQEKAIAPPANLKSKIFAEFEIENDKKQRNISFAKKVPLIKISWLRFVAAASVILLVSSTILNFYFFNEYKKSLAKYDELLASNQTQIASVNQALQTKQHDYDSALSILSIIKDPAMEVVKMPGVPTSPNPSSLATIYWDTRSKDVYLLVNNLPKPATDKQYQLWAIVDGKPVDAGIFDINDSLSFVKMKNIQQAQAFAITLEKRGGSETPTMDAMFVMGKVAG